MKFPLLKIKEAQRLKLCRVCRGEAKPKKMEPYTGEALIIGDEEIWVDPFVLNYGQEYAHLSCLRRLGLTDR